MRWANLRLNKCPKCSAELMEGTKRDSVEPLIKCPACDFTIGLNRLEQLLVKMNRDQSKKESEEHIESFYRN